MTLSSLVGPHVPFLRRYARALTGSQSSGDAYVAALLEKLIANPESLKAGRGDIRLTLYGLLSKLWGSIAVDGGRGRPAADWEASAQEKLARIPEKTRQVFLLGAVEGFSRAEIAQIMEMSEAEVASNYNRASQQISESLASRIMIIEDEPLIAMDLEDIVTDLGHACVGIARTHAEAVKLAATKESSLILSDIQLADGSSGIEAVGEILGSATVPVIFITAFPERLLTGNRPEPAFLITKPFSPDMVKAVVAQALLFGTPQQTN